MIRPKFLLKNMLGLSRKCRCFCDVAQILIEKCKIVVGAGDRRVIRAERFLLDLQGAQITRLRILIPGLLSVKACQVVEGGGDLRVIRAERLLPDLQGTQIARLRILIPGLQLVKDCQVVKGDGDIRVIRARAR